MTVHALCRVWWLRDVQGWALSVDGVVQVCSEVNVRGQVVLSTVYDPHGFQELRGCPNAVIEFTVERSGIVTRPLEVRA